MISCIATNEKKAIMYGLISVSILEGLGKYISFISMGDFVFLS